LNHVGDLAWLQRFQALLSRNQLASWWYDT
jgi:hypothetical protein